METPPYSEGVPALRDYYADRCIMCGRRGDFVLPHPHAVHAQCVASVTDEIPDRILATA